jgi:putative acetyltransferase
VTLEVGRVKSERDFLRLHRLFLEYELDLPPRLRHGVVPEVRELQDAYAAPNAAFLAAIGAKPIGCVAVTRVEEETGLLRHLFVRPQSRGLGAARALVDAVLSFLRRGGYRRVVLDTDKDALLPAYRLYRALGFAECAPHGPVAYDTATFMELRL